MRRVKWVLITIVSVLVIGFFHYSLPSRDIVKVIGIEVVRMDIGGNSWLWASNDAGTNQESHTRDVRFIYSEWPDESPRVYRNEDTNWDWPPYLKFDSGNLQSSAQSFSKSSEDRWVAVTHYGWRIPLISLYPNAIKMKEVSGPNVTLIPWFNIAFLIVVAAITTFIFVRIRKFKRARIDPVLDDVSEAIGGVGETASEAWDTVEDTAKTAGATASGFGAWLRAIGKKWFG